MAKIYQTSENAKKEFLKTRWYKAPYIKTKNAVLDVIKSYGLKETNVNDDYGEILVESRDFNLVVTIYEFKSFETSVDVYIESHYALDFGKTKRIILDFYNDLSKKVEFIALSLHKEV